MSPSRWPAAQGAGPCGAVDQSGRRVSPGPEEQVQCRRGWDSPTEEALWGRRSSGWGGVPSAAFLTGCIAVHAEAVPPRGADGLHGLRVALAAQSSLNKNAREPCLLTANRPTTCPQKPIRTPPAPHSIGHPAAPAAGGVSGTGSENRARGGSAAGGCWEGQGERRGRAAQGGSGQGRTQLWGMQRALGAGAGPGRGRGAPRGDGKPGVSSTVPGMGLNLLGAEGSGRDPTQTEGSPGQGWTQQSRCQRGGNKAELSQSLLPYFCCSHSPAGWPGSGSR